MLYGTIRLEQLVCSAEQSVIRLVNCAVICTKIPPFWKLPEDGQDYAQKYVSLRYPVFFFVLVKVLYLMIGTLCAGSL